MSLRTLPDFLLRGDAELERLMLGMRDANARMRAMMGMGRADPLGAMLTRRSRPEVNEARAWLRHVEAGRIGGSSV